MDAPKKILMMGIAGGLAQITARVILSEHPDWEIFGIDSRETNKIPKLNGLKVKTIKYSRGQFEKLFRENQFDIVYHLGRFSHSTSNAHNNLTRRLELSVMGTNRILELCEHFQIKQVILLSTFHIYGALADNSIFLEEDSPLRASMNYPQLRDVVEMDQICTNWMWKNKDKVKCTVFRPCNIIGSLIQNSMTKFLSSPVSLKPIDFNPMFQFIHEFDMAMVLYKAIDIPGGIYNVATDEYISLREALNVIDKNSIPFPISLASGLNKVLKQFNQEVPPYLIDYLKFSCLIDNKKIKKQLGENPFRFSIKESLKLISN